MALQIVSFIASTSSDVGHVDAETFAVVQDPDLTGDAVRLVLFLRSLGPGAHEVSPQRFRKLFCSRTDKPLYAARKCATDAGYLHWWPGGNSHSTRYELVAQTGNLSPALVAPEGNQSSDRSPNV